MSGRGIGELGPESNTPLPRLLGGSRAEGEPIEEVGLRGAGAIAPGGRGDAPRSVMPLLDRASYETYPPLPVRGVLIPVLCENRFGEGDCWSEIGGEVNKMVCPDGYDCARGAWIVISW